MNPERVAQIVVFVAIALAVVAVIELALRWLP